MDGQEADDLDLPPLAGALAAPAADHARPQPQPLDGSSLAAPFAVQQVLKLNMLKFQKTRELCLPQHCQTLLAERGGQRELAEEPTGTSHGGGEDENVGVGPWMADRKGAVAASWPCGYGGCAGDGEDSRARNLRSSGTEMKQQRFRIRREEKRGAP